MSFDLMPRGFDSIFDSLSKQAPMWSHEVKTLIPQNSVKRTQDGNRVTYHFEVPGFEKDEISVRLDNGVLTVNASTDNKEEDAVQYKSRTYSQVVGFSATNFESRLDKGILQVSFDYPESNESRGQEIPIE